MRDFLEDAGLPLLCIVGAMVVFFSAIIGIFTTLEMYQCSKYESVTGRPTRYEGLSCYVQDEGTWYMWSEYKNRLVAKGEFKK